MATVTAIPMARRSRRTLPRKEVMPVLRVLAASLAVALSPILAVQAYINAGGSALQQAIEWNGFRLANQALRQVESLEDQGQLQLRADPASVKLARQAYGREPFATDALFVIGLMDGAKGTEIYRSSVALDKRNRTIAAMLLQDAAKQNDLPAMLALIDRLSRLRPALAAEFVKAFSSSLADPTSMPVLEQALRNNPVWANAFWKSVPRDRVSLDNFYVLRSKLSNNTDAASDAALITALVSAERYDQAFEFSNSVSGRSKSEPGETVKRDGPLEWQFAQGRNAQARFNASGQLEVFVERGTADELARKLVRLTPGTLTLRGRVMESQGAGEIEAELTCTSEGDQQRWMAQEFTGKAEWKIRDKTCKYAWLTLKGSAWDSPMPLRSVIADLSLN